MTIGLGNIANKVTKRPERQSAMFKFRDNNNR